MKDKPILNTKIEMSWMKHETHIKTRQQLLDEGFKCILVMSAKHLKEPQEIWARFTGYKDTIQYVYHKEYVFTSSIQVISYGNLCMFKKLCEGLNADAYRTGAINEVTEFYDNECHGGE